MKRATDRCRRMGSQFDRGSLLGWGSWAVWCCKSVWGSHFSWGGQVGRRRWIIWKVQVGQKGRVGERSCCLGELINPGRVKLAGGGRSCGRFELDIEVKMDGGVGSGGEN